MSGLRLHVDVTGDTEVRAMLKRIGTELTGKAMDLTAVDVEDYIEAEVGKHTKTGAIFQSIFKKRISDGWELGHDLQRAPHALWVHWGSRPHKILPRKKKVLRWPAGGKFVFSKGVNHPGYKGDPWLVRAASRAPAIFRKHVEQQLANMTR